MLFLTSTAVDIDEEKVTPESYAEIKASLERTFGVADNGSSLAKIVEQAPDEVFLQAFPTLMLQITDHQFPSVMHTLAPLVSIDGVDWDWFRLQISKLRAQGVLYPAIQLNPSGATPV